MAENAQIWGRNFSKNSKKLIKNSIFYFLFKINLRHLWDLLNTFRVIEFIFEAMKFIKIYLKVQYKVIRKWKNTYFFTNLFEVLWSFWWCNRLNLVEDVKSILRRSKSIYHGHKLIYRYSVDFAWMCILSKLPCGKFWNGIRYQAHYNIFQNGQYLFRKDDLKKFFLVTLI